MYNLTVDTAHTFFVGEGEWLVHNCNVPTPRNGATLDFLTEGQIAQIQRFVDASGANVYVFGSRATGVSHSTGLPMTEFSDFDYLIEGTNAKWRRRAQENGRYALPQGRGGGAIGYQGGSGIDVFKPDDWNVEHFGGEIHDIPHILFTPSQ